MHQGIEGWVGRGLWKVGVSGSMSALRQDKKERKPRGD